MSHNSPTYTDCFHFSRISVD